MCSVNSINLFSRNTSFKQNLVLIGFIFLFISFFSVKSLAQPAEKTDSTINNVNTGKLLHICLHMPAKEDTRLTGNCLI